MSDGSWIDPTQTLGITMEATTEIPGRAHRPNQPTLSILIVNWHAARFLKPCLASIYAHVQGLAFEVIVIDNGSFDGSAALISSEFPDVRFVQSHTNLGFAQANNLAFSHARGEYILLLNPDTELMDDAVTAMLGYLTSVRQVGAVGCCLLNSDYTVQWKYVQAFPTLVNQLLAIESLQRAFPQWRMWGLRPVLDYDGTPSDVDVLAGSCLMLKRAVFEQIGLFDSQYYMYGDDVDLCYRLRKAGYSIRYLGSKKIVHHGGASAAFREETEFATVMQRESRLKFFRKTHGETYAQLYRASTGIAAVVRLSVILLMVPLSSLLVERHRLAAGARKWWSILRWALGMESWAANAGIK